MNIFLFFVKQTDGFLRMCSMYVKENPLNCELYELSVSKHAAFFMM